ncbi:uncharacterized protein LOC124313399 [Daphnia pulicaria]|uniref:uncharacterized protein LOC124313399 n=1 Tax=Daphnia pulicaria TaxID=35523 RepID=UPI001EEB467B|nr:uncharacterized protein LOC124313399 [Daphnia pulicaria]
MILKPLEVEEGTEIRIALPDVIEQLTTKLYASRQFKKSERSMSEWGSFFCRFHPTELVLACGVDDKLILLSADNSSIPFSNWKEKLPRQLETGISGKYERIEWNADGTQLAAVSLEGDVIVWSYPDGKILFQQKLNGAGMNRIEWNSFRPNVFATFHVSCLLPLCLFRADLPTSYEIFDQSYI